MIKTIFFTVLTVAFFYIVWINNIFAPHEKYEMPPEHRKIAMDYKYAKEGRELFIQNCASCHSVRYDALYLTQVQANPMLASLQEKYGKVLPRDVYEAVFMNDLNALKESFGKVPPDLSTIYLVKGPEYLYNFILEPQKVLPGTTMPPVMAGRPEETAKIIAYLRSVSEPPPQEKAKRNIMGVVTIGYLIVMGILIWLWRDRILKKMGLH
ncbi:MAG: c-type cytochrome [Thermocrinis sp.]|jgi:ubiquinol-cytochrome c reductase cytochrome c1 subunit|uniref:cytochrome c1 n=1 Tax=Thermocrinis sp. TaxID=2024383 RepID=UPI00157F1DE4|nr:c-type cytochrome [Thermocrinis sp.]NAZ23432.1 c-type cytochrome [Thermocrinis sp.]